MVEEEVLSIGRLRLMPLLVVVVAFEESVGFFSACSFAWSFFQLLDRSVVGAGMLMVALLLLRLWLYCVVLVSEDLINVAVNFSGKDCLAPRLRFPGRVGRRSTGAISSIATPASRQRQYYIHTITAATNSHAVIP